MHLDKKIKANISLTVVIIAGAIMLTSGLAVLSNAIDVTTASKAYLNRSLAEARMGSCIEEAMFRISGNSSYTGTVSVTFTDGSCSVIVTTDPAITTKKVLAITSIVGNYTVTRTMYGLTNTSPLTVSNQ